MPPQYYAVRETDSFADVTLHADRSCPDGPVRAAPQSVAGEPCPACTDAGAGDEDEEPETCQTVKNDGDVCGRELPCPYHSD